MGFLTDSIHAGHRRDPATNAVTTPIYQTSTYAHSRLGEHKGWTYGRADNPTREVLERNLAMLERGEHAVAFASGMAAIAAVGSMLARGDHVVATECLYGGTYRYFTTVLQQQGVEFSFVDSSDLKKLEDALRPETRMVFLESPTNPLLSISDIRAIARLTSAAGIPLVCDNTFASPYFQRPLELGADVVVHSTTKYINGHSDSVGGIAVVRGEQLRDRLKLQRKTVGAGLGPFDAWLALRGTKTLGLRMRQHNDNALHVARFLSTHPAVERVHYPGLTSHPQHALARTQMSGFGGTLSFELTDLERATRMLNALTLAVIAESLGGVETLVCHPASMASEAYSPERRAELGIGDGLVRLSVGCEDAHDIIADLESALSSLT